MRLCSKSYASIPGISAWMEACYSAQPLLYPESHTIKSCHGMQQGDPIGPLWFAITLYPIVTNSIRSPKTHFELMVSR